MRYLSLFFTLFFIQTSFAGMSLNDMPAEKAEEHYRSVSTCVYALQTHLNQYDKKSMKWVYSYLAQKEYKQASTVFLKPLLRHKVDMQQVNVRLLAGLATMNKWSLKQHADDCLTAYKLNLKTKKGV